MVQGALLGVHCPVQRIHIVKPDAVLSQLRTERYVLSEKRTSEGEDCDL